jgi:hypothetical protein
MSEKGEWTSCSDLPIYDTVHRELTPVISVAAMRTVALAWTAAFGLAALGLYLSSLRTIPRMDSREP